MASSPNRAPQAASLLPFQLIDFTVDVDVNGASDGGIFLRSNAGRSVGVLLVVGGITHTGTGLYWHIAPDYRTILSPSAALFKQGDNLHIRIAVHGNTYSAYLNGSLTPATTLVTNSVVSGMVGLYDFTGHVFGNQSFDNFAVTSTAPVTDRCGGFSPQASNPSCTTITGSVCLRFSDGFLWQTQASGIGSWDTFTCPGPVTVEAAYGAAPGIGYAAFLHKLGTNLVKIAPVNSTGAGVQHDFDGNGVPDLVWQNEGTRQVAVDYYGGVGGASLLGWSWLYPGLGAGGWHVRAIADFDGDGAPDLVWQDESSRQVTVHYYGGPGGATDRAWSWLYTGNGGIGWHVVAAADFDGNGVPDLIWQNDTTRQVLVHYYGGPGGASDLAWAWLYSGTGAVGWHVVAASDFNGDGVPDLVWQNDSTKQVTVHYYGGPGGSTDVGWNWLYPSTGAIGWHVAKAADFNNDGVPDLVWENDATGQVTVHYYGSPGGATEIGWNWLYTGNAAGWSVK